MLLRSEHKVRTRPSSLWSLLRLRTVSEARERSVLRLSRDGEGRTHRGRSGVSRETWSGAGLVDASDSTTGGVLAVFIRVHVLRKHRIRVRQSPCVIPAVIDPAEAQGATAPLPERAERPWFTCAMDMTRPDSMFRVKPRIPRTSRSCRPRCVRRTLAQLYRYATETQHCDTRGQGAGCRASRCTWNVRSVTSRPPHGDSSRASWSSVLFRVDSRSTGNVQTERKKTEGHTPVPPCRCARAIRRRRRSIVTSRVGLSPRT